MGEKLAPIATKIVYEDDYVRVWNQIVPAGEAVVASELAVDSSCRSVCEASRRAERVAAANIQAFSAQRERRENSLRCSERVPGDVDGLRPVMRDAKPEPREDGPPCREESSVTFQSDFPTERLAGLEVEVVSPVGDAGDLRAAMSDDE